MKHIVRVLMTIVLVVSCKSEKKNVVKKHSFAHEIVVQEVIQVTGYTYINAKENNRSYWLAAPSTQAKVGETYFFNDGLEMVNFKSKELNKTFETILFLQNIYSNTDTAAVEKPVVPSKSKEKQEKIKIDKEAGVTTIAELYEELEAYKGKKVVIKGKVTKFNEMIMNKNWIHIEDGTDFNGEYDLILTSQEKFTVGAIVTIEGVVATNIDLGYGYKYKLLVEQATQLIHL
ncbi:hypothetical protein [Flavicella marina]|uniref:hypothetical protein n=1 Tax=Flavicella marina TaxID=1475951 RepID=UPI0012643B2E|nr:hypothetical protein [Flavicella marina]